MKIIVDSLTGLSRKFADKLGYEVININDINPNQFSDKFFLVTRNSGFGLIPDSTIKLLDVCSKNCIGTAVSGNRNWGKNYGISGNKIENIYGIKLVQKFEASGLEQDVEIVKKYIEEKINGRK